MSTPSIQTQDSLEILGISHAEHQSALRDVRRYKYEADRSAVELQDQRSALKLLNAKLRENADQYHAQECRLHAELEEAKKKRAQAETLLD